jgi:hypothetical protein
MFQMILRPACGSPLQSIDSVGNGRPAMKPTSAPSRPIDTSFCQRFVASWKAFDSL